MARQVGPVFLQGTYGNVCAYWRCGQWLFRQKSTLTSKQVRTGACFRNTMLYAGLMKRSSKIASAVYAALPAHWKQFWMYRSFVGEAMGMLKEGKTDEAVKQVLWERYAAEFEEGYEEGKACVHKGVAEMPGKTSDEIMELLERIYAEMTGNETGGRGGHHGKLRTRKRCYEELVE